MSKKIAFKTLGCRLNQYETDSLISQFVEAGYELVDFHARADAYVINTCTVTGMSDHKSRNQISQAYRKNDDAILVVTGCMADHYKEALEKDFRITYAIGNKLKSAVFPIIEAHFRGESVSPEELEPAPFGFKPAGHGLHARSLIKIQDGCNNFCTYCIIPFVRGRAISRPAGEIMKNIAAVLAAGFHEIVLTGVNISAWSHGGAGFEDLLEQILASEGDFRLRISSVEPEGFSERFYDMLLHPRLAPHMHLCLQSGSDHILSLMKRNYSVAEYLNIIGQIRRRVPDFNFTTDILVGFPGETEEDFRQTCRVAEEAGFSHIHTFKYSERKGTRAEKMEGKVPEKVKAERSAVIREISERNKREYRASFIGSVQEVLVERTDSRDRAYGYGRHYVPVRFQAQAGTAVKEIVPVKITGICNGEDPDLTGEIPDSDRI